MVNIAIDEKQSGLTPLASCGSASQQCVGTDGTEFICQSYLPPHNFTVRPLEAAIEQWMTIKLLIFLPNKCFSEFR
jgi:hypothetical protein